METTSWSLSAAHDVVAAAVPDATCWSGSRRGAATPRSSGGREVSRVPAAHGLGVRRERSELARWECGQSPVALVIYNRREYVESMLGCFRARAVPFNVNHHYTPAELRAPARHGRRRSARLRAQARARASPTRSPGAGCCSSTSTTARASHRSPAARASSARSSEPAAADASGTFARRPLHGLHGRHDGIAEGRALAAGRRLRRRDGRERRHHRGEPRCERRGRRRHLVPGAAADARRRAVDGFRRHAPRRDDRPPRRLEAASTRAPSSTSVGARARRHDLDRRRRVRAAADRGAPPGAPRPASLHADRDRRRVHDRRVQAGAARAAAAPHHRRRLRRVGDRRDGLRRAGRAGMARAASRPPPARGPLRRPHAASSRRAKTRSAGPRGAGACRSATSATARRPRRPSRSSTASASPCPAIARGCRRRHDPLLGRDSMVVNTGGEKVFVEEVEKALLRHPAVVDVLVVGRPERALRLGGRRHRAAPPGRSSLEPERAARVRARSRSPATRRRAQSRSATRSAATRPASPTTRGRAPSPRMPPPRRHAAS